MVSIVAGGGIDVGGKALRPDATGGGGGAMRSRPLRVPFPPGADRREAVGGPFPPSGTLRTGGPDL